MADRRRKRLKDPEEMATKNDNFKPVISEGRPSYVCTICGRRLSSKQRILLHLHQFHKMSPVKRVRKLYLENENVPVPKRTERRWKHDFRTQPASSHSDGNKGFPNDMPSGSRSNEYSDLKETSEESMHGAEFSDSSENCGSIDADGMLTPNATFETELDYVSSNESIVSAYESDNSEDSKESDKTDYIYSSTDQCSDDDDFVCSETDNNICDSLSEAEHSLHENVCKALNILRCFQRNSLSGTACKDILKTFGSMYLLTLKIF